jgi:hypothetical protein
VTRRPAVRLLLLALAGYAWGAFTNGLPAPSDPAVFWVANLCAPYVILPFLAGSWGFRAPGAALAGAVVTGAAIAGFYGFLTVGDVTNSQLDLAWTVTARDVVIEAYRRWFGTFLLGMPGGIPWLTIGIVVGAVAGVLGFAWRVRAATWAAVGVFGLLLLEPLAYVALATVVPVGPAYAPSGANLATWGGEALVGLVAIVLVARARPRAVASPA